jgi:sugar phosphate isomerase/epimerase
MFSSLMADMIGINCDPFGSIDFAGRFGFDGVDLRLDRFASAFEDRDNIARFRDRLGQLNLRPGYCTFLPGKISCDENEWNDGMKRAAGLAKLARALGYARCASVILPGHDALDFESNWTMHVSRIRQAMDVLNEYGISLALEYVAPKTRRAPFKFPFVHNLRGLVELLDISDRCGVGVLLDSFHWYCARETREDIERLPAHRVVVVHVNDAIPDRPIDEQVVGERLLPGESGAIDLGQFFATLRNIGYDGPVTCEPTHPMWATTDNASAAQRTADALRRFIAAP